MTWAKIDDKLHGNPKFRPVSNDEIAVWLWAISYCADFRTDGFIVEAEALSLAIKRHVGHDVINQLVDHRLFERVEGGFLVHDYLDYNPSAEDLRLQEEKDEITRALGREKGFQNVGRGPNGRFMPKNATAWTASAVQAVEADGKRTASGTVSGPLEGVSGGPFERSEQRELAEITADHRLKTAIAVEAVKKPAEMAGNSTAADRLPPLPGPGPGPGPYPESPGADARAAAAASPASFRLRYAQRLEEPGANRGGMLGAAVREKWGAPPDFKFLGKIAKKFGAMEILTIIDEAPKSLDGDPHDYLEATANRRQAHGRGRDTNREKPSPETASSPRSAAPPALDVPELTPEEGAEIEAAKAQGRRFHQEEQILRSRHKLRARFGAIAERLASLADEHHLADAEVRRLVRQVSESANGRTFDEIEFWRRFEHQRRVGTSPPANGRNGIIHQFHERPPKGNGTKPK